MISTRINLTLVGLFVLAALATLVAVLAVLAGRGGAVDEYHTVFGNVAGLKYGSQVLYEGYPIGQVESIEPLREAERLRFRVNITIAAGWSIPQDSVARSEAGGLLAPQTIAIAAGASKDMLEPGAMIPSGNPEGLFSSLATVAGNVNQVTDQALLPLLTNINRKVDLFGQVLEDLRPILHNADRAMSNLSAASEGVAGVASAKNQARIDRMLGDAEIAVANLRASSGELERVMQAVARNAEPAALNLNLAARNLQDFSRRLRRNPGVLLLSEEQPDDTVPPYQPVDAP